MPSSLECLPNELIYLSINYLSKLDIKALRLTASFLTDVTQLALFGSITIAPYKQSLETLLTLSASPLGLVVKKLVYDTRHLDAEYEFRQRLKVLQARRATSSPSVVSSDIECARASYKDGLFTSARVPRWDARAMLLHLGNSHGIAEFYSLSIALGQLQNLQSVVIIDGLRQYSRAAPLPAFQRKMLRDCGIEYLKESNVSASPAYTASRSCAMYMAIMQVNKVLKHLVCHGSRGIQLAAVQPPSQPYVMLGAPASSLRSLKIYLPQQDAGPRGVTDDAFAFQDTLMRFLRSPGCKLEEFELSLTGVNFDGFLREQSGMCRLNFPTRALRKIKSLLLAGVVLDQSEIEGCSPFQDFLKDRCKTLKSLVLRNVALEYIGESNLKHTSEEIRARHSWPKLIDFMHEKLELKEIRLEGRLISASHFSWNCELWNILERCKRQNLPFEPPTAMDVDQVPVQGLHAQIYEKCLRQRIERYIIKDPAVNENPLRDWRVYLVTYAVSGKVLLHVPQNWMGDWSWRPMGYELYPYTTTDDYAWHAQTCQCPQCMEGLHEAIYALSTGANLPTA